MEGLDLVWVFIMANLLQSSTSLLLQRNQNPRLSEAEWNSYFDREENGPGSYSFGYDIDDTDTGNTQFRQEERFPNGTVEGSYGLTEPDGNIRVVTYIADHLGYRATIKNSLHKNEDYPRRQVQQSHVPSWILKKKSTDTKIQHFPRVPVPPSEFTSNALDQPPSRAPLLSYYKGKFYPLFVNGPISRWNLPKNMYPKQSLFYNNL